MLNIKRNIKIIAIALMLSGMAVAPAHGMWNFLSKAQEKTMKLVGNNQDAVIVGAIVGPVFLGTVGLIWSDSQWTLPKAARAGRLDLVKAFVEQGYSIDDEKDNEGYNALLWASRNGDTAMVKFLLSEFPNINVKDNKGRNPLMWAAGEGHAEIVALFLTCCGKESEYINQKDYNGWTAFLWAARNGNIEVLDLFLKHGVDINKKDDNGWTEFTWAVDQGYTKAVAFFLKNGADLTARFGNGDSLVARVSKKGHMGIFELLHPSGLRFEEEDYSDLANTIMQNNRRLGDGHIEVLELLRNNGTNVDIDGGSKGFFYGRTAFMRAVYRGNWELAEKLLELGANIDERDKDGYTALQSAARCSNVPALKFLLTHGAKIQDFESFYEIYYREVLNFDQDGRFVERLPYYTCLCEDPGMIVRDQPTMDELIEVDSGMVNFLRWWYVSLLNQNDRTIESAIQRLSWGNKETLKLYAPYVCALRACDAWMFKKILQGSRKEGETRLGDGFTKERMQLPVICGNQDKICILADQLFDDNISYFSEESKMSMLKEVIQKCPHKKIRNNMQRLVAMKWLLGQKYFKDLRFSFKKF